MRGTTVEDREAQHLALVLEEEWKRNKGEIDKAVEVVGQITVIT
jgi:hypothetical protein